MQGRAQDFSLGAGKGRKSRPKAESGGAWGSWGGGNKLGGLGKRCELPGGGSGHSPDRSEV